MALGHPLRAAAPTHHLTAASPPAPVPAAPADRARLAALLDHDFADPALLDEALTHASASGRHGRARRSNERLEFLGDRVLGLLVAHLLVERFPGDAEGALTDRHVALVQKRALAEVGEALGLGPLLRVARGEAETGGREKPAILADACEALIGALYLDGGLTPARRFVERHWAPLLARVAAPSPPRDAKMTLQEWAQARGLGLPAYRVLGADGPPHAPRFTVEVRLPDGRPAAAGEGASKRAAEREAARRLLDHLEGTPADG